MPQMSAAIIIPVLSGLDMPHPIRHKPASARLPGRQLMEACHATS
jgi:hypothetical protein